MPSSAARPSFLELNLQSDREFLDVQRPKISLGEELLELAFGIGTLEQHEMEYQFGNGPVHQIQAHFICLLVDRFTGTISSQVENQAPAPGLQDTMHLVQSAQRLCEVLKCPPTKQKVEGLVLERHLSGVAKMEIDLHPGFYRVPSSDLHERLADVDSDDSKIAELCQFNREISRTWCNFEYSALR